MEHDPENTPFHHSSSLQMYLAELLGCQLCTWFINDSYKQWLHIRRHRHTQTHADADTHTQTHTDTQTYTDTPADPVANVLVRMLQVWEEVRLKPVKQFRHSPFLLRHRALQQVQATTQQATRQSRISNQPHSQWNSHAVNRPVNQPFYLLNKQLLYIYTI